RPLSPPRKSAARSTSARSLASENSPQERTRAAASPRAARAGAITFRPASRSHGPAVRSARVCGVSNARAASSVPKWHCGHATTQPEVMQETFATSRPRGHDDFVEVRVMADYRSGCRLDDVGQMRVRETAAQRGNGRCCEDDVPNLAKPDQEDAHPTSVFYGRF